MLQSNHIHFINQLTTFNAYAVPYIPKHLPHAHTHSRKCATQMANPFTTWNPNWHFHNAIELTKIITVILITITEWTASDGSFKIQRQYQKRVKAQPKLTSEFTLHLRLRNTPNKKLKDILLSLVAASFFPPRSPSEHFHFLSL